MTEETPKKPRRKRRTKAQIEAEKAAELAAKEEKEVEMAFGSSYEKEIDEIVEEKEEESDIPYEPVVRDREAEHARTAKKVEEECIPCQESAAAALAAAEAAIESEEVVSKEPVVSARREVYEEPTSTPATYANPNMELIANRWKRKRAERKSNLK